MPAIELNSKDLLEVVQRMAPEEFDDFIARAMSLRAQPIASTLSAQETKIIERINRGLPVQLRKCHARLTGRRKKVPRAEPAKPWDETGACLGRAGSDNGIGRGSRWPLMPWCLVPEQKFGPGNLRQPS